MASPIGSNRCACRRILPSRQDGIGKNGCGAITTPRCACFSAARSSNERTALASKALELGATLTNRATVIILSDLHDEDALPALRLLDQRHDTIALQLADPAEHDLRGAGIFLAQEAETGEVFATHGRKRWLDPELVADDLKRGRIDHLRIPIDRPFLHKLSHFFRTRDRVGRGSR